MIIRYSAARPCLVRAVFKSLEGPTLGQRDQAIYAIHRLLISLCRGGYRRVGCCPIQRLRALNNTRVWKTHGRARCPPSAYGPLEAWHLQAQREQKCKNHHRWCTYAGYLDAKKPREVYSQVQTLMKRLHGGCWRGSMPSQGWTQVGRAARSRLVPYLPYSCQPSFIYHEAHPRATCSGSICP